MIATRAAKVAAATLIAFGAAFLAGTAAISGPAAGTGSLVHADGTPTPVPTTTQLGDVTWGH
ncbi:hypothetical protein ACIA8O_09280 [Kitasatospora sp. NPDC051853]|uniref:hypothetical protein n=1 Tax=Kitasatospora sp. NPDC051853 TaxID=3364058 RepID=UPI0037AFEA95